MIAPEDNEVRGYDDFYKEFDSPLMRQIRQEAYGKDIGQHSWVTADELLENIPRLGLTRASRFLDLGCGPCGPLTFVMAEVGCHGTGLDVSASAITAGHARAATLGLDNFVTLFAADLNEPLPFASDSFDAVISLDVILHLDHREAFFREVARVLSHGGRFLFTDAGVITGPVSNEQLQLRAAHGYTQFVPPGFNERMLATAGFHLLQIEDRTESTLKNATGRLATRLAHRVELESLEGGPPFERQQRYLEAVIDLARTRAMSRFMYLVERRPDY
jgi:SAM-dependent methyltransferase